VAASQQEESRSAVLERACVVLGLGRPRTSTRFSARSAITRCRCVRGQDAIKARVPERVNIVAQYDRARSQPEPGDEAATVVSLKTYVKPPPAAFSPNPLQRIPGATSSAANIAAARDRPDLLSPAARRSRCGHTPGSTWSPPACPSHLRKGNLTLTEPYVARQAVSAKASPT